MTRLNWTRLKRDSKLRKDEHTPKRPKRRKPEYIRRKELIVKRVQQWMKDIPARDYKADQLRRAAFNQMKKLPAYSTFWQIYSHLDSHSLLLTQMECIDGVWQLREPNWQ